MNIDVGDYCCDVDGKMPIGTVQADRLFIGGPMDGTTVRFSEGNEPNGDGSYRVVRVDKVEGFEDGWYQRRRLSPKVIAYQWVPLSE